MIDHEKYEVAIILINYNSASFTQECLKSILKFTAADLRYQIIIVDNGSQEDDFYSLKKYVDSENNTRMQLIRSNINLGFGAGNMLGVHYANADFFAFVNNDSILKNDCISLIISKMKINPHYGICGPFAFKENGDTLPTLDHFASPAKEIFGRKLLEKLNPKIYPNRKIKYTEPQQGQFVAGSFMVLRAADFNEVGGFDTNLFLYYEETDLCKRLAKINKSAFLIPEAEFIHYHGVSTPKTIAIKIELKISFLYIIRKHYGYVWYLVLLNKLRFQYFVKSIFKPKYWHLFFVLLLGAPLSKSLKTRQKINILPNL